MSAPPPVSWRLWRLQPSCVWFHPQSPYNCLSLSLGGDEAASKHSTVPGLQTQMQFSSDPPGGVRVPCPARSWGRSGFLGARGQDHRGGQAIHAQRRDVDLVTAVGGKLRTETQTNPQSEKRRFTQQLSHTACP